MRFLCSQVRHELWSQGASTHTLRPCDRSPIFRRYLRCACLCINTTWRACAFEKVTALKVYPSSQGIRLQAPKDLIFFCLVPLLRWILLLQLWAVTLRRADGRSITNVRGLRRTIGKWKCKLERVANAAVRLPNDQLCVKPARTQTFFSYLIGVEIRWL